MPPNASELVNHVRHNAGNPRELLKGCYRLFQIRSYMPEKIKVDGKMVDHPIWVWRRQVVAAARIRWQSPVLEEHCFRVRTLIVLPRPKSHFRTGKYSHLLRDDAPVWVSKRGAGDVDNYAKAIYDSLEGVIWKNDSQIVQDEVAKRYARHNEKPQAVVVVKVIMKNTDSVWNANNPTDVGLDGKEFFEADWQRENAVAQSLHAMEKPF